MDPYKFTTIAHRHHRTCNPLGERTVEQCLGLLELGAGDRVLDVGCGKGELLLRLVEQTGAHGTGIDLNPAFLEEAEARAQGRVAGDRIAFVLADARTIPAAPESFAAALCVGSTHAFGDYRLALGAMAALVRPGGYVLVGEGYWKRDPDPEYLALLGATRESCTDHEGNVAAGIAAGLVPVFAAVSGDGDWDAYEDLYFETMRSYLGDHPEDPDADALRNRMQAWRDGYLRWGRDTLGFGVYLFRK